MIRIDSIHIELNTENGIYGTGLKLTKGLNIIRANNTMGKSSLFSSILYCLGCEELLGYRNEKSMQSVFKSEVIDNENTYKVLQSEIYLQITNGIDIITIRRAVLHDTRSPQLVDVIFGPYIDTPVEFETKQMYVHDAGAATHTTLGFHKFLVEFIGMTLPQIVSNDGRHIPLYFQLIASALFIEQKSGWSDYYANIPYYNIRETPQKIFEFILNLDVFKTLLIRQEIINGKRIVTEKWQDTFALIKKLSLNASAELVGLQDTPSIINSPKEIYLKYRKNDRYYLSTEIISLLTDEYNQTNSSLKEPISKNIIHLNKKLEESQFNYNKLNINTESLDADLSLRRIRLEKYLKQKQNTIDEIRKNKDAAKMIKLGGDLPTSIAANLCPTCGQETVDTLLPSNSEIIPMKIEENISYLNSQLNMIEALATGLNKSIEEDSVILSDYKASLVRVRNQIRNIKRDLVSDDRLPSAEIIERNLTLERELRFYREVQSQLNDLVQKIIGLSGAWEELKKKESGLPFDYLSKSDVEKVQFFENYFIELLKKFNYTSKEASTIHISREKYLPVYQTEINGKTREFEIRDSSASDLIRVMWAYYTSLLNTSIKKNGNHPKLVMFDEPQQQSTSNIDFKSFLTELEKYQDEQLVVFASFQNSDKDFIESTTQLKNVNIVDLTKTDKKLIASKRFVGEISNAVLNYNDLVQFILTLDVIVRPLNTEITCHPISLNKENLIEEFGLTFSEEEQTWNISTLVGRKCTIEQRLSGFYFIRITY